MNKAIHITANLLIGFIMLFALTLPAHAGSSVTSCEPPTTREDDTTLPPEEIDYYEWYVDGTLIQSTGSCDEFTLTVPGPDGDKTVTAVTVDTEDRRSEPSLGKVKTFTTANPRSPVVN